jgi:hypothetical protein
VNRSEHALQRACAKYLTRALPADAVWTAIDPGAETLDLEEGANRKARGVQAGWPDLVVLWRGVLHGIELKSKTGRLSLEQKKVAAAILAANGRYRLIRTVQALADVLALWGLPCCLNNHEMRAEQYDAMLQERLQRPRKPAGKARKPAAARAISRMHAAGLWRP